MLERLQEIKERYDEISHLLADPDLPKDRERYTQLTKEHAGLEEYMGPYKRLMELEEEISAHDAMRDDPDPEMRELVRDELERLRAEKAELEQAIRALFIPKDPNDDKDVILEIRAGTGGEEAALFAADLFRMYARYAESQGWKVEILSQNDTGKGGLKEIIAGISGRRVYAKLKYESGVHRVQRVPVTEASGRIHTSAVTVAILPEAQEVDIDIDPKDLRIDTYRSSGSGGQHVNKTESAIRITHIPTGLVVTCQDEKSQHKNKAKAMTVLRARLYQKAQEDQHNEIAQERRLQVGTGDRSERIRTYNFPQGRITDHRINLTLHKLSAVLEGDLDEIVEALATESQAQALKQTGT
ncbi:MAG TPA: peptide chain release factor 1 [Deltaproteobacteria bacterium]|nr:peptide chain release factor 1 [Deltaproteobacteria bacterium]